MTTFVRLARRRVLLAAAAAPAALAVVLPATLSAAPTIQADAICARPGQNPDGKKVANPLTITGSGFTPGAVVPIDRGGVPANATVAADGSISVGLDIFDLLSKSAPASTPLVITATDPAQGAATTRVRVAPLTFSASPRRAKPSTITTFRFAGFTPDQPIYAHYRFNGRLRASVKMGRASNPCGLLTARRAQIPVDDANIGLWKVQFSQSKRFRAQSVPRIDATITVTTRLVSR